MSPSKPKLGDPTAIIQAGKLPERTVEICFALDLVDVYEDVKTELEEVAESPAADSLAGTRAGATALREQLVALRGQMEAATVTFRLRALRRPTFRQLKREHPPRKGEDGQPVQRDAMLGINEETFFEPLLRKCMVEPVLDEETFRTLVDERLSDAQYETLTTAAWHANMRSIDLPF